MYIKWPKIHVDLPCYAGCRLEKGHEYACEVPLLQNESETEMQRFMRTVDEELTKQQDSKPAVEVGIKHDDGKNPLELISPFAIESIGRVLAFGKKKYSARNWEKGIAYSRIVGAVFRHMYAYLRGERVDQETGLSHAAHAACELMFLLHFEKTNPSLDDLPKYGQD